MHWNGFKCDTNPSLRSQRAFKHMKMLKPQYKIREATNSEKWISPPLGSCQRWLRLQWCRRTPGGSPSSAKWSKRSGINLWQRVTSLWLYLYGCAHRWRTRYQRPIESRLSLRAPGWTNRNEGGRGVMWRTVSWLDVSTATRSGGRDEFLQSKLAK